MKKIGLVVPYFGRLPKNFQIWLNSCKENSSIDWLIFTDDKANYIYPDNCKVRYMEFDQLLDKLHTIFDFPLGLKSAYKLTDFKVTYGEVFQEYLVNYDFWGYCDIDLTFGDIRKFITSEILDNYDKILTRGHFTLFKNTPEINGFYRKPINGVQPYREVFANPQHFYFDEWGKDGINQIFNTYGVEMYDEIIFNDLFHRKYHFYPAQLLGQDEYKKPSVYLWEKGKLFRFYLDGNNSLAKQEIMYVHFLRRKMKTIYHPENADRILMTPNQYKSVKGSWEEKDIVHYLKTSIPNLDYIKFYFQHFKRKYKL